MSIITELKWEQLLNRTYFRVCRGAIARIGRNVKFHNCHIIINSGSQLEIGNNSTIENTFISIVNGKCVLREHCIIGNKRCKDFERMPHRRRFHHWLWSYCNEKL